MLRQVNALEEYIDKFYLTFCKVLCYDIGAPRSHNRERTIWSRTVALRARFLPYAELVSKQC
jgi:hypothetical protein